MNVINRIARHRRIMRRQRGELQTPSFLVLFINSICNMKCDHCFYWTHLNKRDDLTKDEIFALSRSLGPIENLNLSGGEPFLRREFAEICRQFIDGNGVRQIYVPTNGWYTDKIVQAVTDTLKASTLDLLAVELSLDGLAEFHDRFRVAPGSFARAVTTYDALAELQRTEPRLRIHAISTATDVNVEEIRRLTTYLYDRCPQIDHHNLAIIRGDRKNPALKTPDLTEYARLYDYVRRLWAPREKGRYGAIVEPMLQWAKLQAAEREQQYVPCRAGVLSAVIHANGDVGVCEQRPPLGNVRQRSFMQIWRSHLAGQIRRSIRAKECYCTNEIFMWPSIIFQPVSLAKSMLGARAWKPAPPLAADERCDYGRQGPG
jgi:MoaA/NifB/PqqE/SkfB family radical SAM enzyme